VGTARTIPEDWPPACETALLSVLGYSPEHYPAARGPLEALGRGLRPGPDDQVFRCNLVTLIDGYMRDATAGYIGTPEARRIVDDLNRSLPDRHMRIHAGDSYRNLLIWTNVGPLADVTTIPPDRVLDQPAHKHLPHGRGAEPLARLIRWSQQILVDHDVNLVRRDLGENPATSIWPWGHGPTPNLPPFRERFGLDGAVITGVDLMRGISRLIGWNVVHVSGATGLPGTDYAAKGQAAVAALDGCELVCVHVQAPDEAGRTGRPQEKCRVLEAIDREIVVPVVRRLQQEQQWRVLVIADHATPVARRTQTADRAIFAMAGSGIDSNRGDAFDEPNAEIGELHLDRGSDLMEYFLRR
jgi:2,3-bisphosphoglycerate-independent phosphoglycerate mutase